MSFCRADEIYWDYREFYTIITSDGIVKGNLVHHLCNFHVKLIPLDDQHRIIYIYVLISETIKACLDFLFLLMLLDNVWNWYNLFPIQWPDMCSCIWGMVLPHHEINLTNSSHMINLDSWKWRIGNHNNWGKSDLWCRIFAKGYCLHDCFLTAGGTGWVFLWMLPEWTVF